MYEILRPKFPHILDIIQQIPNTNIADIQKLDEKISLGATRGNKIDKAKKDLFKKITAQVKIMKHFYSTINFHMKYIELRQNEPRTKYLKFNSYKKKIIAPMLNTSTNSSF